MSSKVDLVNRKQEKKRELKPKLRFPEFTDDWFYDVLSHHIKLISGMHLAPDEYDNSEAEDKIPYFTGPSDFTNDMSEVFKWTSRNNKNFAVRGDTLLTVKGSGVGQLMFLELAEVAMGRQLMAASATPDTGKFIFYCLAMRKQYFEALGSGNMIPGIARTDILSTKTPFPKTNKEQQKIADCLSSIDDRITAETQKLDTLKAHKKGLMQQLFPAEGETLPKLRFPEFRDAGEWDEYKFGKLIKVNSGKGFKASEYCNHGIRLLQIENVGYGSTKWNGNTIYLPQNYSAEYPELVLREGDIVLALNRPVTNNELKIAQLQREDEPSLLYQRVGKLELLSNSVVEDFVFHICRIFIKDFVIKQSIGSDQPFISVTTLYAQIILIPSPDEQKRIADCLSSLDELITAQTQKIDTLKTHKKGLMQQLFPALDEVKA